MTSSLPLRERCFDYFFIVMFSLFIVTCITTDLVPIFSGGIDPTSSNPIIQANYKYGAGCDPLFLHPPVWMWIVIGLSGFVYFPFYFVLVAAFIKGWNRIQVPALIYGTSITVITGVLVFGVEFFGEPQYRCQVILKFLPFNLPYVLVPLLLLFRMRRELPFKRKF